jgi:hypothetical protein
MRLVWLLAAVPLAACAVATVSTDDAGGVKDSGGVTDVAIATDTGGPSDSGGGGADVKADVVVDAGSSGAVLQVNEVAPNVTGSADLIELMATKGGDIGGITIEQDITTKVVLATLPSVVGSSGDFIVVHLNATGSVATETTSKTACSDPACYSGAWDVVGGTTGITYSGRAILTRSPDGGAIQDGIPFYNSGTTSPSTFYAQVEALQDAGAWLPANCDGGACSTNALAQAISANWTSAGTAITKSVARTGNADTNKAADWVVGTSSFGVTNP